MVGFFAHYCPSGIPIYPDAIAPATKSSSEGKYPVNVLRLHLHALLFFKCDMPLTQRLLQWLMGQTRRVRMRLRMRNIPKVPGHGGRQRVPHERRVVPRAKPVSGSSTQATLPMSRIRHPTVPRAKPVRGSPTRTVLLLSRLRNPINPQLASPKRQQESGRQGQRPVRLLPRRVSRLITSVSKKASKST